MLLYANNYPFNNFNILFVIDKDSIIMKKKYQIDINEVHKFCATRPLYLKEERDYAKETEDNIKKHLFQEFNGYKRGAVLNGDALKDIFFPTDMKQKYKVFISHSGGDKELVKRIANILENQYSLPCFVDWMVWGNIEKLQEKVDWELCRHTERQDGGTTYSYADRNYTTAHTHAMLSMALLDMIDQCDICLFIKSNHSTIPDANFQDITTLSPWIYEEISYMNHIAVRERRLFAEGGNIPVRISHPLDLSGFEELTSANIIPKLRSLRD